MEHLNYSKFHMKFHFNGAVFRANILHIYFHENYRNGTQKGRSLMTVLLPFCAAAFFLFLILRRKKDAITLGMKEKQRKKSIVSSKH